MAGYVSPPPPHPLGQHRLEIEAKREQLGLDESGFRRDKVDPARADKKAALSALYRRADAHLPLGIGGSRPSDAGTAEEEGQEDGEHQ